ncbi:MAG: hypothetical protein P8M30_01995 [Planctomycetaceae bacterium]|jgi:hypothetical protein|nr:hypothetical protein [Planctomycetaceae bacterium]
MHIIEGEISYDLVMEENMDFIEGAYRLPGGVWEVFVTKTWHVTQLEIKPATWENGSTGIIIQFPLEERSLNKNSIEELMSDYFDIQIWKEVSGPDSMQLR